MLCYTLSLSVCLSTSFPLSLCLSLTLPLSPSLCVSLSLSPPSLSMGGTSITGQRSSC